MKIQLQRREDYFKDIQKKFPRLSKTDVSFYLSPVGYRIPPQSFYSILTENEKAAVEQGIEFTHCPHGLLPKECEDYLRKFRGTPKNHQTKELLGGLSVLPPSLK